MPLTTKDKGKIQKSNKENKSLEHLGNIKELLSGLSNYDKVEKTLRSISRAIEEKKTPEHNYKELLDAIKLVVKSSREDSNLKSTALLKGLKEYIVQSEGNNTKLIDVFSKSQSASIEALTKQVDSLKKEIANSKDAEWEMTVVRSSYNRQIETIKAKRIK